MTTHRILPVLILAGASALPAQSMYRGDPAHTGVYPAVSGNFGGLRWRVRTEGPVRSSPAVANGTVYVGSSDGNLYAIDERSGDVRWKMDARSPVTSSPAVAGGLVIFGTRAGNWLALDARTGSRRWSIAAGADLPLPWGGESGDYWTSSPTIGGDVAYLGGGDGVLRAVNVATGRVRWTARTEGRMRASPAVGGGLVVTGDIQGVVYAFDAATGAQRWRYDTFGHTLGSDTFGYDRRTIQSSPAIADGRVYVGARDGFLYALDLATGAFAWKFDHQVSWVNTSPAVEQGRVYAGSSDRAFIQAVDATTGREIWRRQTALTWASAAVSGDLVYSPDGGGRITVLDKATGAVRWRWAGAGGGVFSSPVIADGCLFVGTDDGAVYALDVSAAHQLHRAVYWDSTFARANTVLGDVAIKTYFASRDYEVLDDAGLDRFLAARIADREPSVVVFATDYVRPPFDLEGNPPLLRRWLDAGGTAVWPGLPPALFPFDSAGQRSLLRITRDATARLLGVRHEHAIFDRDGTADVRPAGRRLGMLPGFLSAWSADTTDVTTLLSVDEFGLASAWTKSFGGPAGTGFVRIPAVPAGAGGVANLQVLLTAAELRPTS